MTVLRQSISDALTLWGLQRLSSTSFRIRVSTFLRLCAFTVAIAVPVTMVLAFVLARVVLHFGPQITGQTQTFVAWTLALVLALWFGYGGLGSIFREAFTAVRYVVHASPVRGLWISLDIPLRHVVGVERGTEQLPRIGIGCGVIGGAALGLAVAGEFVPAVTALCSLGLLIAVEATCHTIALRNATHPNVRSAPFGLWETYLALSGLAIGVGAAKLVGIDWTMSAERATDVVSRVDVAALAAIAMGMAALGIICAVVALRRLMSTWRTGDDVPLLGFDDPAVLVHRWTLLSRYARPTAVGAVVWGTGSMTIQPPVVAIFRGLLAASAIAIGAAIIVGPLVNLVNLPGVDLASTIRGPVVAAVSGLTMFICAMTAISSGHEAQFWQYRSLWELGVHSRRLWAAHIAGSLVQVGAVAIVFAAGYAAVVGRIPWEVILVALAAPLGEHLAESSLARPSRGDADEGPANTASAVVGLALAIPAVVAGTVGGAGTQLLPVYILALAIGGLWCFDVRVKTLRVLVAP